MIKLSRMQEIGERNVNKNTESPRWEYRIFGEVLPELDAIRSEYKPTRQESSSEIYILTKNLSINCKLRQDQGLIKIKKMLSKTILEEWQPVFKNVLPLSGLTLMEISKLLELDSPVIDDEVYNAEKLIQFFVKQDQVTKLNVLKIRTGYTIDDVFCETAEFIIGNRTFCTIEIENERSDRVFEMIRKLRLDSGYTNQSYPEFLNALNHMKG